MKTPTVYFTSALAGHAHAGQVDKAGKPYIDHPIAVAAALVEYGDNAVMAGLLHDVVEDTDITLDVLRTLGYPEEVVRAVDSVTRRDGELYSKLIERAAADPLGCLVKLADNRHNTDRLDNLDEPIRSGMARRYAKARKVLLAAQQEREWATAHRARLAVHETQS